jgi:porin
MYSSRRVCQHEFLQHRKRPVATTSGTTPAAQDPERRSGREKTSNAGWEVSMKASLLGSRSIAGAVGMAVALAWPCLSVLGQEPGGAGIASSTQQALPKIPEPQPAAPEHLLGDWGGVRTYLRNLGINLDVDYTTESAGNPSGGLRQGVDYAHQIGVQFDVDWDKLAGIPGFSTHLAMVNRAGRNLSSDRIGDNVIQAQEIFGAGFDMLVHDVWFYGEEKLFDGRADAVFGRVFPGMDFAASPLYCNFMTLTICGHPRALTAEQGFIDWPQNTWGGRLRVRPTPDTYVMAGVYASQPFPGGGRSGFDWSSNHVTGAYYAAELAWEPMFGRDQLPGHYKIGVGYDTSDFDNNYADVNGNAFVLTGLPPRKRHGRTQAWVTFDQMLVRTGPALNDGLTMLGAYAHDSSENSLYEHFLWGGLLYSGFWKQRPHDQIGLGVTYYKVAPSLTHTESLEQEFGLAPTYVYGVQTHAMVFEANYNIAVYRGVYVQPELEYFLRPGGVSSVPSAFVIGLKTHIQL